MMMMSEQRVRFAISFEELHCLEFQYFYIHTADHKTVIVDACKVVSMFFLLWLDYSIARTHMRAPYGERLDWAIRAYQSWLGDFESVECASWLMLRQRREIQCGLVVDSFDAFDVILYWENILHLLNLISSKCAWKSNKYFTLFLPFNLHENN